MNRSTQEAVIAAEQTLLDPAIRTDPVALDTWLDPEFTEIGQSGRFWTREAVLADLTTSDQSRYETAELSETRVLELAECVYLLTYVVQIGERRSRRSSIYRMRDGGPCMVFNQGTPLSNGGDSK